MNADVLEVATRLIGTAAAIAATLYGLAALWVVYGSSGWLLRCAPLTLLLAALAPIGAYDLLMLYGLQAVVVIGICLLVRRIKQRRSQPISQLSTFASTQFLLRDVLKFILLAGVTLAILRCAISDPAETSGGKDWSPWMIAGTELGVVTLLTAWTTFSHARWYYRMCVLVPVVSISGATWFGLQNLVFVQTAVGVTVEPTRAFQLSPWFSGLPILACLVLIRRTGYPGRVNEATVGDGLPSSADVAPDTHLQWRWPARAALVAVVVLGVGMLSVIYRALLLPAKPVLDPLPDPNGYTELIRAAATLDWVTIPEQDFDKVPLESSQRFVLANAAPLAVARQAMLLPWRCPVAYDDPGYSSMSFEDIEAARNMARAMWFEARVASAEGRSVDAVKIYLDVLRLSRGFSCGGLALHELVGNSMENISLNGLSEELRKLDRNGLAELQSRIETIPKEREPVEAILQRERISNSFTTGWRVRLESWCESLGLGEGQVPNALFQNRAHGNAKLRLIIADAAIRRFILTEGSPPKSLVELVPEYMSELPQDPFGAGPLIFRHSADGYLLYSVGANGTDDGGERVSRYEAITKGEGDLFVDASDYPPIEQVGVEGDTDG